MIERPIIRKLPNDQPIKSTVIRATNVMTSLNICHVRNGGKCQSHVSNNLTNRREYLNIAHIATLILRPIFKTDLQTL